MICIYGVRITFVLFTPVPETGCPMWHAGLTLTLTFACSRHEWRQLIDSLFVDDTCGKSSYVVECGEDCGANT